MTLHAYRQMLLGSIARQCWGAVALSLLCSGASVLLAALSSILLLFLGTFLAGIAVASVADLWLIRAYDVPEGSPQEEPY